MEIRVFESLIPFDDLADATTGCLHPPLLQLFKECKRALQLKALGEEGCCEAWCLGEVAFKAMLWCETTRFKLLGLLQTMQRKGVVGKWLCAKADVSSSHIPHRARALKSSGHYPTIRHCAGQPEPASGSIYLSLLSVVSKSNDFMLQN